jgi:hypothetical protein
VQHFEASYSTHKKYEILLTYNLPSQNKAVNVGDDDCCQSDFALHKLG